MMKNIGNAKTKESIIFIRIKLRQYKMTMIYLNKIFHLKKLKLNQ